MTTKEKLVQSLQALSDSLDRLAKLSREQQLAILARLDAMDADEM